MKALEFNSNIELSYALPKIDFLSSLPAGEIYDLGKRFRKISIRKGEVVCRQGEPGDSLFIIQSGIVNVHVKDQEHGRVVAQLHRGDFFGERAILTGEPRMATVTAALDTDLFELRKTDFEQLLFRNPSVALHIARVLSSRLNKTGINISACAPCFFSVIGSHPHLGSSRLAARLSELVASGTSKSILVVDLDEPRGQVLDLLGGCRIDCPDKRLVEDLSSNVRDALRDAWYKSPAGITILQLPHTESRQFAAEIRSRLSSILEILKSKFSLVLFDLHHEINTVSKRVLRLSDTVLFVISNTQEDFSTVRERLERLQGIVRPAFCHIKVGISHMRGESGLYRTYIRDRLVLSEIPDIWFSRDEKKYPDETRKLAREISRRRVGIALGAGGARGWAHLGVLKALDERGIPIDMIAGCSIGALAGALYCKTGSAGAAIEVALSNFSSVRQVKKNVYDYGLSGGGLLKGNRILEVIREMLDGADFLDLHIPLSIIAVDMATGQEVILEEGSVSEAVRASISSPGMFSPFKIKGRWLTDGALLNPLPVNVLVNKGSDFVLASAVEAGTYEQWPENGKPSILGTLARSFSIMFSRAAAESVHRSDISIHPDVRGYKWGDFHRGGELVKRGEEACLKKIDEIERLVLLHN